MLMEWISLEPLQGRVIFTFTNFILFKNRISVGDITIGLM